MHLARCLNGSDSDSDSDSQIHRIFTRHPACDLVEFGIMQISLKRRGNFFALQFGLKLFLLCAIFFSTHVAHAANESWAMLARGGYAIVMRHAVTVSGVGDPPGFVLDDCTTQRNLSTEGRAQAERWRASIEQYKVPIGEVFSSAWCRCLDTAQLAFGNVALTTKWSALNSFFESAQNQPAQTATVKKRLPALLEGNKKRGKNVVLVTHQVNITALTGVAPQSGEAVVIELDTQRKIRVVARLLVE
jgi:phosphohistidine phosphatase SixA